MAGSNVDMSVITKTQESLGRYVKKPPLTEKLLSKPPFRFLHDLFNALIRETGYFEGLYTTDELNIDNIKDRDDKMRFLQKMIDLIQNVTKSPLTVRASKIVAGQEAEKTNELLQLMALVIDKQLNWRVALPLGMEMKETIGKDKPKEKETTKPKESKSKELATKTSKVDRAKRPTKETVKKEVVKRESKEKGDRKEREKDKSKPTKPKASTTTTTSRLKKTSSQSSSSPEGAKRNTEFSVSPPKQEAPIKEEPRENPRKPEKEQEVTKIPAKEEVTPNRSKESKEVTTKSANEEYTNVKDVEAEHTSATSRQTTKMEAPKNFDVMTTDGHSTSRRPSAEERKGSGRKASAKRVTREEETRPLDVVSNGESVKATREADSSLSKELKRESTFVQDNNNNKTKETVAAPLVANANSNAVRPRTSLRPPSARPASARPGAPRRRDKNVEIILQPNEQLKMSGVSVKLESFGDLDDDGENLVIIEQANADIMMGMNGGGGEGAPSTKPADGLTQMGGADDDQQQGHLVQQIIETQKQLTQQSGDDDKNQTESRLGSAVNGRQSSARQMNSLRDVIQSLTKSVHPFAKLMDFIPEDIDAMQLEMTMWRDTFTQASVELKRERSLTESATEPMKNQLVQIEANIKEYVDMIANSRTKILQNSEKILKMLTEQ